MTEVKQLCFSYGKHQVLKDLSFSVKGGECLILAGANGSGKSTALSLISGAVKANSGQIITESKIGFAPQGTALFEDVSVEANLRFFASLAGCQVPPKFCFGVERYAKKKVSRLSGGMKKQVSIACALLGDPQLILFDEPCEALDINYREELACLIKDLKKAGKSIIYVGHEPTEFAGFYDKLIFLKNGHGREYSRAELSGGQEDLESFCNAFKALFI